MREALSSEDDGYAPISQFARAFFLRWYVLADLALVAAGCLEHLHLTRLALLTRLLGRIDPFVPDLLVLASAVVFAIAAFMSWRQEHARALQHFEYSSTLAQELARQSRDLEIALDKVKKMQEAPRSLGMARDMSNRASFEIHSAKKRLDAITAEITHMKDKLDFLNEDLKKPNTSLASAMSVLNQTIVEMKLDAEIGDAPAKPALKR
jgi:septal ring factor EnvC (AmiA/AmiB activator)